MQGITPKEFIGVKAKYDARGTMIWGISKTGEHQLILDVRGWGAIQNLFKEKNGSIDPEKAAIFQDELGEWIADAINQKLNSRHDESNWIDCNIQMPKTNITHGIMNVSEPLMYWNGHSCCVGWVERFTADSLDIKKGDIFFNGMGQIKCKPTFWKPLPAPPKYQISKTEGK